MAWVKTPGVKMDQKRRPYTLENSCRHVQLSKCHPGARERVYVYAPPGQLSRVVLCFFTAGKGTRGVPYIKQPGQRQ